MLLKARLTSPRPLTLGQLKAVADGAVAAAQWTTRADPVGVDRLTGNLVRAGIGVDRDRVVGLLQIPPERVPGTAGMA